MQGVGAGEEFACVFSVAIGAAAPASTRLWQGVPGDGSIWTPAGVAALPAYLGVKPIRKNDLRANPWPDRHARRAV